MLGGFGGSLIKTGCASTELVELSEDTSLKKYLNLQK